MIFWLGFITHGILRRCNGKFFHCWHKFISSEAVPYKGKCEFKREAKVVEIHFMKYLCCRCSKEKRATI